MYETHSFFFFVFEFYFIFKLYITVLVLPNIKMNPPQVHSEGDQPWDFFGRNDAEAETPVLWPPHAKS